MAEEAPRVLANALKFFGETMFLPGSSLMWEGRIGSGVLHTVAAVAAGGLLGPLGTLMVIANSYSKSVNDQNLWELGSPAVQSVVAETVRPTRPSPSDRPGARSSSAPERSGG
jgi:hypothetical protein